MMHHKTCWRTLEGFSSQTELIPEQRSEREVIKMIDSRTGWRSFDITTVNVTNCLFSLGSHGCSFVGPVVKDFQQVVVDSAQISLIIFSFLFSSSIAASSCHSKTKHLLKINQSPATREDKTAHACCTPQYKGLIFTYKPLYLSYEPLFS